MRLDVDTGAYADAVEVLSSANHAVTDAAARLVDVLDVSGGMSGTDAGGRAWAESYDRVASRLVRAQADLGGALGASANTLDASLANHEGADRSACLFPAAVGVAPASRAGSERFTPAELPTAFGGTGGEPAGWQWLAEHLQGLLWPDADTASMRRAADAWSDAATTLDRSAYTAGDASALLESQRSPEAPIAARAATELSRHGAELAAACRDVGRGCQEYAAHVDEAHDEIAATCRELLAWTAVDQATGAVLSFVTGGGAEVAAQLVETGVMARYAARVVAVLRRLLELARAAAALISRGLARVTEILARLKVFLSLRTLRAMERVGVTIVGRRLLTRIPDEMGVQVKDAIERALARKERFPRHDGKEFLNENPSFRLPPGDYHEWTVAAAGSKRGVYRILINGDPANPKAIYLWDHVNPPVRIRP